jgi:hypothetical protein
MSQIRASLEYKNDNWMLQYNIFATIWDLFEYWNKRWKDVFEIVVTSTGLKEQINREGSRSKQPTFISEITYED